MNIPLLFSLLVVLFLGTVVVVDGKGGEKAFYVARDYLPTDVSYRQDVCDRWEMFRSRDFGSRALKEGLSGMELNVVLGAYQDAYFNYDEETGIDPTYPGLAAVIMDELAKRANFTWRNSFAIYKDANDYNSTWKELHLWATDSFDLTVDWWPITVDRMNTGVVFLKEWLDSSFLLIGIQQDDSEHKKFNILNWMQPFNTEVWLTIVATIILSAIVHMLLEYFANDRDNRSLWTWWSENFYLSFLNFSQIYEYHPTSSAGRFFGMSMSIWALVMTATYTANLASLLVDQRPPPPGPQSLAQAAVLGYRICVWEGTSAEFYVKENFDDAIVIPLQSQPELYHGLYSGECDYSIDSVASWNKFKAIQDHNPKCQLYWVGGEGKFITKSAAGFTCKADAGNLCSGFVRDVLNIHMHDIIEDGTLDLAWERDLRMTQTIDCENYQPGDNADSDASDAVGCSNNGEHRGRDRTRRLQQNSQNQQQPQPYGTRKNHFQRLLQSTVSGTNSGDGATASAGGGADDAQRLTLSQMLGIFIVHWFFSGVALVIAATKCFLKRFAQVRAPSIGHTPQGKRFNESMRIQREQATAHDLQDIKEQLATLQQLMELQMHQQNQKMENMQQSKLKMQQQIQNQMQQHTQKMKQYEDLLLKWSSTSSYSGRGSGGGEAKRDT